MKPNILVIFADQMRADTMGCAGHPCIKTPNLDRLAAEGVRFSNAYTPDPICVPARAAFTTGNYPHKCTGIKNNSGRIGDDQVKIAEFFSQNGYVSYAAGKLHYVPYAEPGEPRLVHGFDHVALAESGRIVVKHDPSGETGGLEDYHDYLKSVGWGGYERAHGVGNNDVHPAPSPLPAEHYVDSWVCTRSIEYLDAHRRDQPDQPFFLFMSCPKPHAPYDPPRPYDGMYDPRDMPAPRVAQDGDDGQGRTPTKFEERATHGWDRWAPAMSRVARAHYCGQVSFQDEQIGRMLAYLEERGELDNTIVVYTADHGDLMGDFGFFAKSSFYKGSVDIPLLIRWPDGVKGGRTLDPLVGLQDLLPTLASLAGLDLPRAVDGVDLSPLLRGDRFEEREYIVSTCLDEPRQLYMVADKHWKYMFSQVNRVEELYDLDNDPDELCNVASDPATGEVLALMRQRAIDWARANGDAAILDGDRLKGGPEDVLDGVTFAPGSMGWRWC